MRSPDRVVDLLTGLNFAADEIEATSPESMKLITSLALSIGGSNSIKN
jgi:hypothetical protein